MTIKEKLRTMKRRMLATIAPVYETKKIFRGNFGYACNLKNPISINEKLQKLKLGEYYNNPIITKCVDKFAIREYLEHKNLLDLCPKLYGVYENPSEIIWSDLPEAFVLKCNHGCGYNILVPHKEQVKESECKETLRRWMKEDYWKVFVEVQYKYVTKKIIAEEYLGDDLLTYKFYCFNGIPRVVYVSSNGENGEKDKYINYFDTNWNELPYCLGGHEKKEGDIKCPDNLKELVKYARVLSEDFPFVRVDLYSVNNKIYISELTFIPTGGFMHLSPEGTDHEWGEWLEI